MYFRIISNGRRLCQSWKHLHPIRSMRSYNQKAGCLIVRVGDKFAVVTPKGKILSRHDSEAKAQAKAQYINLINLEQARRVETDTT